MKQNKMQRMSLLTLTNGVGTFLISSDHLLVDFCDRRWQEPIGSTFKWNHAYLADSKYICICMEVQVNSSRMCNVVQYKLSAREVP